MANQAHAQLEAIWIKTERKKPMKSVPEARLIEGKGIEGSIDQGGYRQVTLLDADAWETATKSLGVDVEPDARRANLLVRGVDLEETKGRVICVADSRIAIRGETLPCERMEEAAPGLKKALKPAWRGGVYGIVLTGGTLALGAPVKWE